MSTNEGISPDPNEEYLGEECDCDCGMHDSAAEASMAREGETEPQFSKVSRLASLTNNFWDTSLPDGEARFKAMVNCWAENFPEDFPEGLPWQPEIPGGLAAISNHTQVIIAWNDVETETGYKLLKIRQSTGDFEEWSFEENVTEYVDTNVVPEETYQYYVGSFNHNGSMGLSEPISVVVPAVPEPTGEAIDSVVLEVDKAGVVYSGIPFHAGYIPSEVFVEVRGASGVRIPADLVPVEKWKGGLLKWAHVKFKAPVAGDYTVSIFEEERQPIGNLVENPASLPFQVTLNGETLNLDPLIFTQTNVLSEAEPVSVLTSQKIEVKSWCRKHSDGSYRVILRVANKNPTTLNDRGSHPETTGWGSANDRNISMSVQGSEPIFVRRANVRQINDGLNTVVLHTGTGSDNTDNLRPGEGRFWELTVGCEAEPPIALAPADRYTETRVTDPIAAFRIDVPATINYELNMIVGINTIYSNRNSRPRWKNSREDGEDQRDWDGGTPDDVQTHNDEYETNYGYLLQSLRTAQMTDPLLGSGFARKAFNLGDIGSLHHATVDMYDIQEGPLHWMWNMNFQHTKHGGAGNGNMHRSSFHPNTGHLNGRSFRLNYLLTGNPICQEAFEKLAEAVMWKVENGPGMPGLAEAYGAGRNAANLLGVALDYYSMVEDSSRIKPVILSVIEQQTARSAYDVNTTSKYKPWQVATYLGRLQVAAESPDLEIGNAADTALDRCVTAVLGGYVPPQDTEYGVKPAHCMYQRNPDNDENSVAMWSVVCADTIMDYDLDKARLLFDSGCRYTWYWDRWGGNDVGKYARLLQHTVLNVWGGRMMRFLHAESS